MAADAAAWAQAYLSAAAILASGALAIFVPWNERRLTRLREQAARLGIECRRSTSGGLEIVISYVPEFHYYAIGASLYLMTPTDARVYKGQNEGDENIQGRLGRNVRYNAVSLLRDRKVPTQNVHSGVMIIEYPDERSGPKSAEVRIDVLVHGNHRIFSKKIRLTAIDDQYYLNGGPTAILVGTHS
ncbi:hypothetical protein [Sandarakinorhabdus sp. DWP1-3-1]|uniref:hypothetical protein n=1 Tax=Sandarakinorhabdus sp. DWP1-3-1 TaxID=2804627 RepID=UPI003CF9BECC